MEPNHPNTRQFVRVIGEIWAEYVQSHSLAECEELSRRVAQNRAARQHLFGQPQALTADEDGSPPGREERAKGAREIP